MFTFKNKNSNNMGVFAKEESFLGKAQMHNETIKIDGRNGEEVIELGYKNFHSVLKDVVMMKDNRDEVMSWLSGVGTLEYLGKKTTIRFLDSYEVMKHNRPFSVPFVRDPFWYSLTDDYEVVTDNVINLGNTISQPIIKLTKTTSDIVQIKINNIYFTYDFKDDDYVEIDCFEMDAKTDGMLRNRNLTIGYEFPKLKQGDNPIELISGTVKIEIKRKDVWL